MSSASGPNTVDVKDVIRGLLNRREHVRNRDVAAELGFAISRQAIHQHLQAMVATGELERLGVGKASQYRRAVLAARTYPTAGLDESQVWTELRSDVAIFRDLPEVADSSLAYVFTEMVNNVVDHSGSATVTVRVNIDGQLVLIDVDDVGVGIFAKVAAALGSASVLEAAQRLTLGKFTTWPARHTGEGIFFSSRIAHLFLVEANGLRWTVDNERGDWAVGEVPPRIGTLVRFGLNPGTAVSPSEVFRRFTDEEFRFDTTTAVVKMLDAGVRFVSRSEAKRLAEGLTDFTRVVLDFDGVTEVGQGFVDELFRVWATAHPDKQLEPVNMSEAVRFMVERGLPRP